jgi:hypothetical protein
MRASIWITINYSSETMEANQSDMFSPAEGIGNYRFCNWPSGIKSK